MTKFWKAALGVAGIGAIGLFVFWSLYKEWLSLPIFPELTQIQAYNLLKIFLFLTFGALVISIIAYFFTHKPNAKDENYVPVNNENLRLPNGTRFTDEQFETYRNVWIVLQDVKNTGNSLWERASTNNLDAFADALRSAVNLIDDGSIFFTKTDYKKLEQLLHEFEKYRSGKQRLIELRSTDEYQLEDIRMQIRQNENHMNEYSKLLKNIRGNYHDRFSWKKTI